MPHAREIAATNSFFAKAKIHHCRLAGGTGATEGIPDRVALIDGYPLFIEFKEGKIVQHPEGPQLSFSGKHGLKASQINWFRQWLRRGGHAGLMVSVPIHHGRKPVRDRYFFKLNPPNWFLTRLKRSGGFLHEFVEIEPTEEAFKKALNKFFLDIRSRKDNPLWQTFQQIANGQDDEGLFQTQQEGDESGEG